LKQETSGHLSIILNSYDPEICLSAGYSAIVPSLQAQNSPATAPAERHESALTASVPKAAPSLPQAKLVDGTYGHLNAAKDNVIPVPSHCMANLHRYEWIIGPARALNPADLFFVAPELFANGRSSSHSKTRAVPRTPVSRS
jgi:homoserine O-acetyltransferase